MSPCVECKSDMVFAITNGSITITLSEPERQALERLISNRNTPAKVVRRGRIMLATACGLRTLAVCSANGATKKTAWRCCQRHMAEHIAIEMHGRVLRTVGSVSLNYRERRDPACSGRKNGINWNGSSAARWPGAARSHGRNAQETGSITVPRSPRSLGLP